MTVGFSLGEPNFVSASALRAYCSHGRQLLRPLGPELHMAAVELRAALKEIPGHRIGNVDSRVRARIVASHLNHAADGIEVAVAGLIRTYLSFEKHFIHVTPDRSKRYFDLSS